MARGGWPDEYEPDPRWEVQPEPYDDNVPAHRRRIAVGAIVLALIAFVLLTGVARSALPM